MDYILTFDDGSSAYLAHYGVKGMRWGVWNEDTEARYKGFRGLKYRNSGNLDGRASRSAKLNFGSKRKSEAEMDKVDQSAMMKYTVRSGSLPKSSDFGPVKNLASRVKHPDVFKMKETPTTADQDMAVINPFHSLGESAFYDKIADPSKKNSWKYDEYSKAVTNCVACSMVYDLRRRGFDVDANMTENMMNSSQDLMYYYSDLEEKQHKDIESMDAELLKEPDGARGAVMGVTVGLSGHSIAWEKENGQIIYRDCQTNTKYTSKDLGNLFSSELTAIYRGGFQTYRLDDKTPNLESMYEHGIVSKAGSDSAADYADDKARDKAGMYARRARYMSQGRAKFEDYGYGGLADFVSQAVGDVARTRKKYDKIAATEDFMNKNVRNRMKKLFQK